MRKTITVDVERESGRESEGEREKERTSNQTNEIVGPCKDTLVCSDVLDEC